MSEYSFSGIVTDDFIREQIKDYHLGLIKSTKLTGEIRQFADMLYEKYRTEGD